MSMVYVETVACLVCASQGLDNFVSIVVGHFKRQKNKKN